jgi:hypothetical protein
MHMAEPSTVALPNLLPIFEAAPYVPCAPSTLADPDYRRRLAIPCYRIGGRLFFDPKELAEWRERRRQVPGA